MFSWSGWWRDDGCDKYLDICLSIGIFWLKRYGDLSVPRHTLELSSSVLSQYLDDDEDGEVDYAKVLKVLSKEMEE